MLTVVLGICLRPWMLHPQAITAWRELNEPMRLKLVASYFAAAQVFEPAEVLDGLELPDMNASAVGLEKVLQDVRNALFGMWSDPFYAVVAYKKKE